MFCPVARETVLAELMFVHVRMLPKETVAVKAPISLPPVPVNVKAPPVGGRNELAGCAE